MKAIVCHNLDGPTALKLEDVNPPTVGPNRVVVDIKAAALNFPDVLMTHGAYQRQPERPFIPGVEGAGIVTQVGDNVTDFAIGARVLFTCDHGAFAEAITLTANQCLPLPDAMSFAQGAAFTIAYATSYHALKQRAALQEGETIAVLGAAGGVGLATVELAKAMGATVIACASNDAKLAVCEDAGADHRINYTHTDLKTELKAIAPKAIDVIYDPVGGSLSEAALRALAVGGRHLVIGFTSGHIPRLPLNLPLLKQCQIIGVFWGAWSKENPSAHRQNMDDLFTMFADGAIKPRIDMTVALDDFQSAFARLTERRVKGKVVFTLE